MDLDKPNLYEIIGTKEALITALVSKNEELSQRVKELEEQAAGNSFRLGELEERLSRLNR